jgi:adenylate cyclase
MEGAMSVTQPASCAGCGGVLLPGAAFCQRCGQKVGLACRGCGLALEAGFAFCPRCGTAQQQQPKKEAPAPAAANDNDAQAADRRQVTVLFADLTGFTSLAEGLDPETLRTFQNALFELMAQAVARYDGFVEKFVGDAVMAVFGAPRAHEDDPVRAIDAALDMLSGIDALSRRWAARLSRPVTLHIGVHTGAVVAGSLGQDAGGSYAVTGDTVNATARLLNAAEPGTVLVSAATHALARHRFEFGPPAELALRGKTQPMQVYRVIGLREAAASPRGLAELGLEAPLIGRDDALAQLLEAFGRMQAGKAQLVCLLGEAGAGKSRLLAEFFACLGRDCAPQLAATSVRRSSCSSLGEPTYGTFGALFRDAYRVEQGDSLAVAQHKLQEGLAALGADAGEAEAVARVLNYLLGLQEGRPQDIEPEQLQRQISLAARALLERRLAQQPLMIVVDDVHWADAASIDLLAEALDHLAERPLMLLLSQRPDARPVHALTAQQTLVELGPLATDDTRRLVDQLLGMPGDAQLAPVRELVAARAGGNPLFVEEIVRSLAGAGRLVRRGERWICGPEVRTLDVPPTLYGLLLSRIDRLGSEERQTLQEAAVLGAEFDAALLRRIAGAPPASTDAALASLARTELLHPDAKGDGTRWRFTHALLHDVAYQNLLLVRRSELHGRAGRALEQEADSTIGQGGDAATRSPRRLAELEALGHHWSLSSDKARGARYLLQAGDWARAVYANEDAMRHYQRALRTLDEASPAAGDEATSALLRLDAGERLADLQGLAGRREEALAHYAAIEQALAAEDGARADPVRAARVLRKTGGLHWEAGERERAAACFNAGLAALGEGGDAIERAHLFQELGRLAFRAGDNAGALNWAQRALAEVPAPAADGGAITTAQDERERAATIVRAEASNTLGVALARLGRPAEAVERIEASVAQAEAHDLLQAACRGYTNLGVLYATLDPQRSIETCLRGLETARKVGDLAFQSRLYANLAVAYCALTNRCEAEGIEAAQAAVQLDRRLGLVDHLAVPLIVLGQIHQCHGDHARAFAAYNEALQLAEEVNEPQLLFPCYDGLATLYLDAGRPQQAEAWLAKAQALCERAGLEPDALMVLPFLC